MGLTCLARGFARSIQGVAQARQGEINKSIQEWAEVMGGPDESFNDIIGELLDDWGKNEWCTNEHVDVLCYKRVVSSRVYVIAGDQMVPGRFLSDHLKMRELLPTWTERFWGYFMRAVMLKKFKSASKVWQKMLDHRQKNAVAKESVLAAEGAGMHVSKSVSTTHATPLRRFCFAFMGINSVLGLFDTWMLPTRWMR